MASNTVQVTPHVTSDERELLIKARGCPITGGCPETRILKDSFIRMCKLHQSDTKTVTRTGFQVKRKNLCPCDTGILVQNDKEFIPPDGVMFINIDMFVTPKHKSKPKCILKPEPVRVLKPKPTPKPKPVAQQAGRAVKLTPKKALAIREAYKQGSILVKDLAEKYGTHTQTILDVISGKTWRNA